ncbi:hypothetical protein [Streptomyces sp. AcE210]|uniref:hypothetical protein n=1 Tax=Streptomyces sp. AcE210 TaxID=2292703 RepID=UPI00105861D6|nr:hypothetical protein [Streptomyces sp. AcE210]
MEAFFSEVGKKLTDRWLTAILLPGLLFAIAVVCAAVLGHGQPFDLHLAIQWLDDRIAERRKKPSGNIVLLIGTLAAAGSLGLVANWLSHAVSRVWIGSGLRMRQAFFAVRWTVLCGRNLGWRIAGRSTRPWVTALPPTAPSRQPTWMRRRIRRAGRRIAVGYGISMELAWPRLWQIVPADAKIEVTDAWARYTAATLQASWGLLYLVLGLWWWPALIIGAIVLTVGCIRGRLSVDALALLVEATVDTHIHSLAQVLGVSLPHGRVTPAEGLWIDEILRKAR